MKNKIILFTSIFIFVCILYVSVIYFFQNKFLFDPDINYKSPQMIGTPNFIENPIIVKDGTKIMTWYYEGEKDKPLILFFHGNTGQISYCAGIIDEFTHLGYSVAMLEYRGFGNTEGTISQQNVFSDATEFYDYYIAKFPNKIVINYGYSFGCAVVLGLSQFRQPNGIILTAPFSSFYQEVKDKPVPFAYKLINDYYPSDKYIKYVQCPLLIIHGTADELIKHYHSQTLFNNAISIPTEQKKLVFVDGINHHDIFFNKENFPAIIDWLKQFN